MPNSLEKRAVKSSASSCGSAAANNAGRRRVAVGGLQVAEGGEDVPVERLIAGVEAIPELRIQGEPKMTLFAVVSDEVDVFEVLFVVRQRERHRAARRQQVGGASVPARQVHR